MREERDKTTDERIKEDLEKIVRALCETCKNEESETDEEDVK